MTAPPRRKGDAGISLVEVLVVLVLVGVMAGAIGLSLNSAGQGDAAGREARLMAARLTRAADETVLAGEPMALVWRGDRYRLVRYHDGEWAAFDVPILAERHDLPNGVRLEAAPATGGAVATTGTVTADTLTAGTDTVGGGTAFIVGADLLPLSGAALRLALVPDGGPPVIMVFNGATARPEAGI